MSVNLELLVTELAATHGAHTIILYGSRAAGTAAEDSDIDIAVFADVPEPRRDARHWEGICLDAFVYPTAVLAEPGPELLRLCRGDVLLDERGLANALMSRLLEIEKTGPGALPADESRMRRLWGPKTLERARRYDIEGNYRRHQLLFTALEDHYAFSERWYPGPKRAFAQLASESKETCALFERALAPSATLDDVAALIAHVYAAIPDSSETPGEPDAHLRARR